MEACEADPKLFFAKNTLKQDYIVYVLLSIGFFAMNRLLRNELSIKMILK